MQAKTLFLRIETSPGPPGDVKSNILNGSFTKAGAGMNGKDTLCFRIRVADDLKSAKGGGIGLFHSKASGNKNGQLAKTDRSIQFCVGFQCGNTGKVNGIVTKAGGNATVFQQGKGDLLVMIAEAALVVKTRFCVFAVIFYGAVSMKPELGELRFFDGVQQKTKAKQKNNDREEHTFVAGKGKQIPIV